MRDRIPTKLLANGAVRYAVYNESGAFLRYDYMLPADEPRDEGTALNKANILSDDIETKIWGASADRTIGDVFNKVSELYQHCWRRRAYEVVIVSGEQETITIANPERTNTSVTVNYSDNVVLDETGAVVLATPILTTGSFTGLNLTNSSVLAGKYLSDTSGNICYCEDAPTFEYIDSEYYFHALGRKITAEVPSSEWKYISSVERDTYPDSGVEGGFEYEYLGVPFDNAKTAPKIEIVSYVGTGTYGVDNPCEIAFSFSPKIVRFLGCLNDSTASFNDAEYSGDSYNRNTTIMDMVTTEYQEYRGFLRGGASGATAFKGKKSADGKTLYWYFSASKSNGQTYQLNDTGRTYYFVAEG